MSINSSVNRQSDRRSVSNSLNLTDIFESKQETEVAPDFSISRNDYYKRHLLEIVHDSRDSSNLLQFRSMMLIAFSEKLCEQSTKETERLRELRLELVALLDYQRKKGTTSGPIE